MAVFELLARVFGNLVKKVSEDTIFFYKISTPNMDGGSEIFWVVVVLCKKMLLNPYSECIGFWIEIGKGLG